MSVIHHALFPVLSLILLGFMIRRTEFLPPSFWPSAEKLTYFVLMPALLIDSLARKEIGSLPWQALLWTVVGTVLCSALLLTVWGRLRRRHLSGALFTSLFQGGVRFNTFVALALASALFGVDGLLLAALGAGLMIVLINVLCVSAFVLSIAGAGGSFRAFALSLAANPLILGCLIGGALNVSGIGLPSPVDGLFALTGKAAFPLGLMAVGAAFRLTRVSAYWELLLVSSVVQLVAKPLIALWLAGSCGLTGMAASVAVLLFAVPTAPSAYILSRQMGGDHESMAAIITVQTALTFITLPVTLALLL